MPACSSRFHFPVLLGSTVVTRFTAAMRTLTPDPLLQHRVRYPWFTKHALPDIPSPPTHAPLLQQCFWLRADLAPDSPFRLSAGVLTSFTTRSLVSRIRPYRVCVAGVVSPTVLRTICSLPVALHVALPGRSFFQLSGGKHRQGGTLSLRCTLAPKRTGAAFMPLPGQNSWRHEKFGNARFARLKRRKRRAPAAVASLHPAPKRRIDNGGRASSVL